MYWNFPLRSMIETYIIVALCSLINFKRLRWHTNWDVINSTLSLVFFGIIAIVPVIISILLHKYKTRLSTKKLKSKFGTIYSEMRTNISGSGLIKYISYYYIRRLALATTVVMLGHVLVIQFFIFIMTSIFQIILVGFIEPYENKRHNNTEIINEILTIFIMYHIFCFTEWVPDANVQYNLGYSCLVFNLMNIGFNVLQLFACTVVDIYHAARKVLIIQKFKRNRKKIQMKFNTKSFSIRKREFDHRRKMRGFDAIDVKPRP